MRTASEERLDSSALLRPKRAMGFVDLVLFYVVTGISLRWIATAAAAGPSAVVIWLGAWLLFYTPLALSVVELSSRYPNQGGLYVWSKRGLGDFSGFICAWIYWTSNLPYFPSILYFAAGNILYIAGAKWNHLADDPQFYILFAIISLCGVTLLNIVGLDIGKWLHNVGAFAMWVPVIILIIMGIVAWRRFGSATSFSPAALVPSTRLKDVIFWSSLTFAFSGCEAASFMAEEIKNTRRAIPWALFTAGTIVTACYILGTIAVLLALPPNRINDLQGLMETIISSASSVGVFWIVPIAAVLITLSNLGAAGAYLASVARLPFVAGIDHFLPPTFAKLHPRWRTPYIALLVQLFFGVLFAFLGQAGTTVRGAYDVLVSMGIITYFLPYLFLFAAMFRLQDEVPGPDVLTVPGGKPIARFIAVVGFVASALTIVLSAFPSPGEQHPFLAVTKVVGGTLALIACGALIYFRSKRSSVSKDF